MTSAGIEPICKKHKINVGISTGRAITPRNITERNLALYIYTSHFCLTWKTQKISFNQAKE